jgi:hypothetical protein
MVRRIAIVAAVLAFAACGKKKSGLPPAQEWNADQASKDTPVQPPNPHGIVGMDPSNPHAGVDMSGDPNNPHAGMVAGGDPHAGLDVNGTDVSKLGLPPPDPDRKIDPSHRIKGVIAVSPKVADRAPVGGVVFVNVRRADASGQPSGAPLAVAKLTYQGGDLPFELTEGQAMVAGTELAGDVVVSARYDHDGDAMSKQPGDVVGSLRVKVPADAVKISLDTVLP